MALESPIALSARGILPETWDALANSSFYGESLLDIKQKYVKFAIFATVVNEIDEDEIYNPLVIEFAAKNLALQLIPPGADYWSNRLISVQSTGTSESKTFPDRIASLWRIHARLLQEIQEMIPLVQQYIPNTSVKRIWALPGNSGAGRITLTTDPQLFPPMERLLPGTSATSWTSTLPWSEWN